MFGHISTDTHKQIENSSPYCRKAPNDPEHKYCTVQSMGMGKRRDELRFSRSALDNLSCRGSRFKTNLKMFVTHYVKITVAINQVIYQVGNTSSHKITEVKQLGPQLALR